MEKLFHKRQTLEEIQAENERLRAEAENENLELSIEQKRAVRAHLRQSGLTLKSFGGSFRAALNWLKGRN